MTGDDHRAPGAPVDAYIGLGSNKGDRVAALDAASATLGAVPGVRLEAISRYYETEPWGYTDQPRFLNAVVRITTTLGPRQLLTVLKWIERRQGRQPGTRWGPRVIDLDLLLFDDLRLNQPGIVVPHRHLEERAFVLVPLRDVFADFRPATAPSLDDLIARLDADRLVWPALDRGKRGALESGQPDERARVQPDARAAGGKVERT